MSEFLDHLISRSVNIPAGPKAGNFLQPRLPSLFEDPAGAMDAGPAFPDDRGVESRTPRPALGEGREEKFPVITGSAFTHRDFVLRLGSEPAPAWNEPGANPVPDLGGKFSAIPAGGGAAHIRSVLESNQRFPQLEQKQEASFPPSEPDSKERPEESLPVIARRVEMRLPAAAPERKAVREPRGRDETREQNPILHPRVGPLPVMMENPDAPVAARSSRKRKQKAYPDGSGLEAGGNSAPDVQIHIGRIEVRAVVPSPPQPVRDPALQRPKLTLDEYLRRRSKAD